MRWFCFSCLLACGVLSLVACDSAGDKPAALQDDERSITAIDTVIDDTGTTEVIPSSDDRGASVESTELGLAETTLEGPASITDLILITGQSNALGAETSFDPVLDASVERFYAYTDSGWQLASLEQVWDLGWHPKVSSDGDPHNNFGLHFGKSIAAARTDKVVGIVLVTAPGEGISHWDYETYFYQKVRNKALAALNELPQKVSFDGILWHQGETDWSADGSLDLDLGGVQVNNDYYSNKLWSLITNFRNESWFDYGKPFLCGETAQSPVNSRLMALNRDSDYWTGCVDGVGLPTYDDAGVHFSASGLREMGANYADAYLQMTGS